MNLQIIAISPNGESEDITDYLYWFEENGVTDWHGHAVSGHWRFEISVDGQIVFDSFHPEATWSGKVS